MKKMTINPEVTIYITNYNYGKYISQAIKSCLNQLFKNLENNFINKIKEKSTDTIRKNK